MAPIGIFDSGLGGLSVLMHARLLLPERSFVYLADQGRAPYGEQPSSTVREYAETIVSGLLDEGADAIVVACNTASDAALDHLRMLHPGLPIVGMEPAVKPAVAATRSGVIGVLATTGTIRGRRLASVIDRFAGATRVLTQACPGLVEIVEDGLAGSPQATDLVAEYALPMVEAGADTLVLGCTHYTFLAETLATIVGPDVRIIDPAEAVAIQLSRVAPPRSDGPTTRYETSGDPVRMRVQLREILGEDAPVYSPVWIERR